MVDFPSLIVCYSKLYEIPFTSDGYVIRVRDDVVLTSIGEQPSYVVREDTYSIISTGKQPFYIERSETANLDSDFYEYQYGGDTDDMSISSSITIDQDA